MELPKLESVQLLQYLFAGLLAAWVYYGLSGTRKPDPAERVVQALIFTVFVQFMAGAEHLALNSLGKLYAVGPWTSFSTTAATTLSAVGLGITAAHTKFRGLLFEGLRRLGLTKLSGHFGEWRRAFDEEERYVVLQLKDGRRLYGYPKEFPVEPDTGHFRMTIAAWLPLEPNTPAVELSESAFVLINASDVSWVEFTNLDSEINDDEKRAPIAQAAAPLGGAVHSNSQGRDQSFADAGSPSSASAASKGAET